MSDIRNFFKKIPNSNQKRTRDQTDEDTEEEEFVPKPAPKISNKKPVEKVISPPPKPKANPPATLSKKTTPPATPPKKMKTTEVDPAEKKKRAEMYKSFVNRSGPSAPGSKDIPDGEPDCLKDLAFVISGVLDSLERDECKKLIEKYGGRVTIAISKKTNYLIAGSDAGESKSNKAREYKIDIISEDDLLEMIRTRPGDEKPTTSKAAKPKPKRKSSSNATTTDSKPPVDDSHLLWADKYKPKTLKDLVGQQGDKSCVQKLIVWLRDWYKHHGQGDEKVKSEAFVWLQSK